MKKTLPIVILVIYNFVHLQSFSQIDFTSLDPEVTLELPDSIGINYLSLDVDNNGEVDFKFGVRYFTTMETTPREIPSYNSEIVSVDSNALSPGPFSQGDSISSSLRFYPYEEIYCWIPEFGGRLGSWAHQLSSPDDISFIGLKLVKNNREYYGWAKIRTNGRSLNIYSYAINTIPDQFILAGQEN